MEKKKFNVIKEEKVDFNPETIFKLDENGNILPEGKIENIRPPWNLVVDKVKNIYLNKFKDNILSVYVSGSVARGVPDAESSDLDMFAIVKDQISEEEAGRFKFETRTEIRELKPFSPRLDIRVIPVSHLTGENGSYRLRFITKLLSTPVYGKDFTNELPDFKANNETAIGLMQDLKSDLEKRRNDLLKADDPNKIQTLCRRVTKRIIRNAFYTIMGKEGVFTNSLETSVVLFNKNFPEKSALMNEAYEMSQNLSKDKEKIIKIIDELGMWVADTNNKLAKKI